MKKKVVLSILVLALTMMCVPTEVYASETENPIITKEITVQDKEYIIEITTIIEQENVSLYATTNTKTVSKICKIKNTFGSVVATYTLKGTFSYDGTTAVCTNATYTTSTESILCSFDSATAYASGAKAIGSFTVKNLWQTVLDTVTITCSKTGVIS